MSHALPLALVLLIMPCSVLRLDAQDFDGVFPGRRLRLWAPKPTVGTLIRADSAGFVLVTGDGRDTVTISRHAVRRADISHGQHGATAEGTLVGALAGGFVGGLVGAGSYHKPDCNRQTDLFCWDLGPAVVVAGVAIGALSGAVLGAAIGSQTRVEEWKRARPIAEFRVTAAPSPDGLRLGVSASF